MSTEEKIAAVYDRIKDLCKEKGVTQTEMCNACGMNIQSHRGRITRNIAPDVFDTVKIAQFLNVSVEYLITGKEKNIYKKKYDTLLTDIESFIEKVKND
jgi:transcriptional regulator with XRE-family HTH domain